MPNQAMPRSSIRIIVGAVVLLVAAVLSLWYRGRKPEPSVDSKIPAPVGGPVYAAFHSQPLPGEGVLAHYADPARPPEEDLVWMARALDNFTLLVKGDSPLPFGANEEIARALLGHNKVGLRFLPGTHPALNDSGQLVDRWGTPLFFHAVSRDRLDLRSAGPDREMWTADDIHRRHDGRFLHGEELLAASLLEASTAKGR